LDVDATVNYLYIISVSLIAHFKYMYVRGSTELVENLIGVEAMGYISFNMVLLKLVIKHRPDWPLGSYADCTFICAK